MYASTLADPRARFIAEQTAQYARALLRDQGGDPETTLRLLGKAAYCLMRYAGSAGSFT